MNKIKTSLLLLTICIGIAGKKASAQTSYFIDDYKLFYGGVVLGTNISQVDGDDYRGYDKYGLNVGAIVYARLEEHIAASMEILYSQKGSKSNGPTSLEPGVYIQDYGINLNYAEVPILINYFTKQKSNFGAGLSYSRLANSKETLTEVGVKTPDLNNYPFKKDDFNIVVGGNVYIYKGLFLNLRFQYSLVSIRDNIPQNYINAAQYNNMWVIRFMYLFF